MRRTIYLIPATVAVLLASACGGNAPPQSAPTPDTSGSVETGDPSAEPTPSVVTITVTQQGGGGGGGGGSSWPSPEDCVSYNPNNLSLSSQNNDNVTWIVRAGSTELVRVKGDQENGTHALNVAKRYKKVCFIGRHNNRSEKDDYIFEYWRDPSGINSSLPSSEDVCRNYDRNNLTINSMDEDGWRVLDHNDPLGIFDTQQDANNGKLVLAKYGHICEVYSDSEDSLFGVKITYTR